MRKNVLNDVTRTKILDDVSKLRTGLITKNQLKALWPNRSIQSLVGIWNQHQLKIKQGMVPNKTHLNTTFNVTEVVFDRITTPVTVKTVDNKLVIST